MLQHIRMLHARLFWAVKLPHCGSETFGVAETSDNWEQ